MQPATDETILFEGHPSWRSIIGFYLKGLALAVLAGALAALVSRISEDHVKTGWVAVAVAVVFGLVLLVGLLKRIATTYTISDHRLHIKRGIVSRRVQETRLANVQNVNTSQGALQRILQVGTVDFDTAGTGNADFAFVGVANPDEVVQAVGRAQHTAATEDRASAEQQPPQAPGPAGPPAAPPPAG